MFFCASCVFLPRRPRDERCAKWCCGLFFFLFFDWGGCVWGGVMCLCLFIHPLFTRCRVFSHAPIKSLICLKYKQSLTRSLSLAGATVRLLSSSRTRRRMRICRHKPANVSGCKGKKRGGGSIDLLLFRRTSSDIYGGLIGLILDQTRHTNPKLLQ